MLAGKADADDISDSMKTALSIDKVQTIMDQTRQFV
jgi:hypothetical protein